MRHPVCDPVRDPSPGPPPRRPFPAVAVPLDVAAARRERLRVLCLADDADHAELVRFALERIPGFAVEFECERMLSKAVEIPAVSHVDAVFIDVGPRIVSSPRLALPTEVALARSIRECGYGGLLVVLTVDDDPATVSTLKEAGADACLRRRDSRPELLEQVLRATRDPIAHLEPHGAPGTSELRRAPGPGSAAAFAAEIAHQLRQPLQTIGLEVALLRADPVSSQVRQSIDKIESQAWRCERILRRALAIARARRTDPAPRSLDEAVRAAAAAARCFAARAVLVVEELGTDLPLTAVEPAAVEQSALEPLIHAIESAGTAGPVTVRTSAAARGVRLTVEDAGAREKPNGEPLGDAPRAISASGMGLSLVHRLVQRVQGTIEVRSGRDLGTSVSVELPVAVTPALLDPATA